MNDQGKKVLFVLSGGGAPGLDIHLGIWRALSDSGIHATEISGTSAGAIIGSLNAFGWSASSAEDFIRGMEADHIRHERSAWPLRLPWIESIFLNDYIYAMLSGCLPESWGDIKIPFSAWACEKRTGTIINAARPEFAEMPAIAVLASMSICGIFPSIRLLDGLFYVDAGYRFNLPLPENWTEFDDVYLLVATPRPELYIKNDVVSNLLRNMQIMHKGIVTNVIDRVSRDPRIRVIWPDIHDSTSLLKFNHNLIDRAYSATLQIFNGTMDCQAGR